MKISVLCLLALLWGCGDNLNCESETRDTWSREVARACGELCVDSDQESGDCWPKCMQFVRRKCNHPNEGNR